MCRWLAAAGVILAAGMTMSVAAQGVQTVEFAADNAGQQVLTGILSDANASLDVQMQGMTAGATVTVEASGDSTMDLAVFIDSAYDTRILNNVGVGDSESVIYTFPADGDYVVSLFTLTSGGSYTLRLTVPSLAVAEAETAPAAGEAPLPIRSLESTEQQLAEFQSSSAGDAAVRVQQGTVNTALEEVRITLDDLRIGDTVYAVVSGPTITPLLTLGDATLANRYAQDQNAGAARSAAIVHQVERAGQYVLTFFSINGTGEYVLRYGINTPELMTDMSNAPTSSGGSRNHFVSRGTSAQRFTGTMTPSDTITVRVQGVRVGDIVYAAATGRGNFDPVLSLRDRNGTPLIADDNSGGGTVAVIQFTAGVEGELVLSMTAHVGGEYSLLTGVNTPGVLESVGLGSTTNLFGAGEFTMAAGGTREFGGQFSNQYDRVVVTLTAVRPGDTIYAFAEGLGGLDPYIMLYSPGFQYILAEDDDSGGGTASAIAHTVDQFGDYTLLLYSVGGSGGYRIVAGTNNASILSDNAARAVDAAREAGFDCTRAEPEGRPELSGPVQTIESPNAIVHFTTTGYDATTLEYARILSEAIENSLDVQFNDLGWRKPPADCGLGGDDRLDVYVLDIPFGAIGYARPENMVGDNPNTPEVELYSAFSYLVIENDMDFLELAREEGYDADPIDLMRVTAAHEVHHAIQFGYDTNETYYGFYESGAMWIETLVYPELSDAYEYDALFENPDLCLGSRADQNRLRVYAEWVMVDSFARDLGPLAYQQLWEYLSTRDNMAGLYEGFELLGTTVEEVVGRMAIRNLLLDYANAERFRRGVVISDGVRAAGIINSGERGTQQQAVDYLRVVPGVWRFELRSGNNIRMRLVGINRQTGTATSFDLGTRGTVDTRPYDAAFLIVQNTTRHRQVEDCYFTIWSIDVREGSVDTLTLPDADVWNATRYRDVNP